MSILTLKYCLQDISLEYKRLKLQNRNIILLIVLPLGVCESQFFFVIDSPIIVSSVKSVAGFETSMSSKICLLFGK